MMSLSLYVKNKLAPSIISFQVFKDENRLAVINPLTEVMANVQERTEGSCFSFSYVCIFIFFIIIFRLGGGGVFEIVLFFDARRR
jgi:hypothetical protein